MKQWQRHVSQSDYCGIIADEFESPVGLFTPARVKINTRESRSSFLDLS